MILIAEGGWGMSGDGLIGWGLDQYPAIARECLDSAIEAVRSEQIPVVGMVSPLGWVDEGAPCEYCGCSEHEDEGDICVYFEDGQLAKDDEDDDKDSPPCPLTQLPWCHEDKDYMRTWFGATGKTTAKLVEKS